MLVRTFALWAALATSASAGIAMLVPAPTGRPAPGATVGAALAADPGPPAPGAHFLDGKTLLLDGRLGHASVPRASARAATFLLATVTGADPVGDRPAAPPVHFAIVVDRSGSMAGPKMANAIAAATGTVERMRDGDRATVVVFDTTARILVPPTTLDASTRPAVLAALRTIRPGGDTCISCALERATEALDASPAARDEVRRVLLISDGEATTGVRDATGLRTLAARARDRGLTVSTLGVDITFDEKVMAAIAQESNGRHWFVPDPGALLRVFDEELGSLEASVASLAELVIEPEPGVVLDDVLDRPFRREGRRIVVPLGAFDGKQEKTVLASVRVPSDETGTRPVVRLSLTYRDVAQQRDGACSGVLALDVRDDGTAQRELDPFVAARVERNRTAHALLQANELFARGRATEARAALDRRKDDLEKAAPLAVAQAAKLAPTAAGAPRDIGGDFGAQDEALSRAQAGFAAPPAAGPMPAASTPEGKSALKRNQASATDLAF